MREPVYDRWGVSVFHGDNLDVLRGMPDCSVDSVVTDPPAGIAFMGKAWDTDRGGRREWVAWLTERMTETLRVLKPGGHALVWSMPRTSHWTGWALEDAGFEVRDVVQHAYEQGFPKSLDISKEIDRRAPREGMFEAFATHFWTCWQRSGLRRSDFVPHFPHYKNPASVMAQLSNWKLAKNVPSVRDFEILRALIGLDGDWTVLLARAEAERQVVGSRTGGIHSAFDYAKTGKPGASRTFDLTAPSSLRAKSWQGWGTALRPAAEPWWLVRKPFAQTVAANVQEHGTGAVNIDACRGQDGQWPANVAKFPKAPPSERPMVDGQQHPTVKSVALCRWLVRLVTPPNGTVLDLFAGTGPVGQAARAEGFKAVLIEQDAQSIGFIRARLDARAKTEAGAAADDGEPMDLLDLLGGDAS